MHSEKLHYEVLEVPVTASFKTIHEAYLRKARALDPKSMSLASKIDALAEDKMAKLIEAYQVLSNETLRARYDQLLLKTKGLSIGEDGSISREHFEEETRLSAEELKEAMERVIKKIRSQIEELDCEIDWDEREQRELNLSLAGKKNNERYYVHIITSNILDANCIENLIECMNQFIPVGGHIATNNYSLFLIVCLGTMSTEKTRADIFNFNNASLNKYRCSRDTIRIALMDLKEKELYFPYCKSFQPDMRKLSLPKGYKLIN